MYVRYGESATIGALLTSMFHQLFPGNSGSGTGIGPPCTGAPRRGRDARITTPAKTTNVLRESIRRSSANNPPALVRPLTSELPAIVGRRDAETPLERAAERVGAAESDRRRDSFDRHPARGEPLLRLAQPQIFHERRGRALEETREAPRELARAETRALRECLDG